MRTLGADLEAPQILHRVAQKINPDSLVSLRREDIDDPTPHRELSSSFDPIGAFVPQPGKTFDQGGKGNVFSPPNYNRIWG
jgi:hypothetical protein